MRSTATCSLLGSAFLAILAGCAIQSREPPEVGTHHDRLYIRPNGEMRLNHLPVDSNDVVIYPDGRGGERAAVKVRTRVHPAFYRDSIAVIREPHPEEPAP